MSRRRRRGVAPPGSPGLRETTGLPPVVADGYGMDMAGRPFLMQGSAGHFYPINSYVSIMLTPIRRAYLTRGGCAYHQRE